MSKRSKSWDLGLHFGKTLGVPTAAKGLITGAGAGMVVGGVAGGDDTVTIVGLIVAFIGITA